MKKKTITLFLMILVLFFVYGCSSKNSASAEKTTLQSTEEAATTQEEHTEDLEKKTPEQLVAEGMEYFYATNGKLYDKDKAKELFSMIKVVSR